jgi:hypothetical protein
MLRHVLILCVLAIGLSGCERFQTPTKQDCEQAVTNLVSRSVDTGIESAFPSEGGGSIEDMASSLLKGVGKQLLTSAVVDDQKIAWCEVNMSLHDANCLRAAQSNTTAFGCGYFINEKGVLAKMP